MSTVNNKIFLIILLVQFCCLITSNTLFGEDIQSGAQNMIINTENTKTHSQGEKITTLCPPGTKVKVEVGKESDDVKDVNVTTICGQGSEVEVSVGSADVEANKQVKGDIKRKVTKSNITTITGKGAKSSVNVGSVKVGR